MMMVPAAISLILLAWSVLGNLVLGDTGYLPRNLALAVAVLVAARSLGITSGELGLARDRLGAGLRWGLITAGVVAAALAVALLLDEYVGPLAALLDDDRADVDGTTLLFTALVRIPFGTVVFEELAFRGLLLAACMRAFPQRRAILWAGVVFGVWHIPPTIIALEANVIDPAGVVGVAAIAAGVVATGVAGAVFAWLRVRSGSLLAPMLAHLATNSLGLLAAWLAR